MQLFLIRHAESRNNRWDSDRKRQGASRRSEDMPSEDPELTELGREQARTMALHVTQRNDKTDSRDGRNEVGGHGFQRIVCSPMLRALETASAVARATSISPEVWTDIHEEGGIWPRKGGAGNQSSAGLGRIEMAKRFPEFAVPDDVRDNGWWHRPIESRSVTKERAGRVARKIGELAKSTDKRMALISHGTFINFLIQHLVTGRATGSVEIRTHNTGISRLDFEEDRIALRYLNRVDHLSELQVT